MASIRKKGNTWSVRISWQENGKQRQREKSGFKTKAEAKKYGIEQEEFMNKGFGILAKDVPFADYFKTWYTTFKTKDVSPITLKRYKNFYKQISKFFDVQGIQTITRLNYQEFINEYGATHAPDTVNKLNAIVKNCVQSALLDGLIQRDFTLGITITSNKDKILQVEYLNIDEIKAVMHAATSKLEKNYTSRYMIITAILTGMRLGEISALTWNDIDFEKQTININKSWDAQSGIKPTKTKSSIRTIAVPKELLDILSDLKVNKNEYVFLNQYQRIPGSNAVNKTLRSLLDECNLVKRGFHFHSLRHSHVAFLLYKNVDIYAISKRLGHANITTTINKYAYLMQEHEVRENELILKGIREMFFTREE